MDDSHAQQQSSRSSPGVKRPITAGFTGMADSPPARLQGRHRRQTEQISRVRGARARSACAGKARAGKGRAPVARRGSLAECNSRPPVIASAW
jgi:hypothetical protein